MSRQPQEGPARPATDCQDGQPPSRKWTAPHRLWSPAPQDPTNPRSREEALAAARGAGRAPTVQAQQHSSQFA